MSADAVRLNRIISPDIQYPSPRRTRWNKLNVSNSLEWFEQRTNLDAWMKIIFLHFKYQNYEYE